MILVAMLRRCLIVGVLLVGVLVALTLSGCASTHPGSADRTVAGTYVQVFEATRMVLEERGFPIRTLDREEGRIETGKRPDMMTAPYRRVEQATVRLRRTDDAVTVNLLLAFDDQVSDPPPRIERDDDDDRADDVLRTAFSQAFDASVIYDDYLDAIEDTVASFQEGDPQNTDAPTDQR